MKGRNSPIANATHLIGILILVGLLIGTVTQGQTPALVPGFGADGGPEATEGDPDLGAFGMPSVLREEDPATDPALFENKSDILPERYLLRSVPWRAPDYSAQEGSLGWTPDLFQVPPTLATRVAFWKEIYSKYTTDQGVLHDIDDLSIVYEAVDFTLIMKDSRTSLKAKARARTKLVNERRDDISKRLRRLAQAKSEKDVRDELDRKFLSFFTKESPGTLFPKDRKDKDRAKNLKELQKRIQASANKKKIRFQLGQKDKFILGVYYSGRYLRAMEKQFRAERLPVELTRLPFVESSFNIQARSRVGASGVWQFMPRTAKPWMMVNRDVDERNDPKTATAAAARLMRSNFEQLREWPLALTAYNHGAAGVARAVKKTGSRDLAVIIDRYSSRRFGFASSNFYACFLAALDVEKNARTLLGDVKWSLEFDGTEIDLEKPMSWETVVDFYDGEAPLAELQNPHLTSNVRTSGSKSRPIPKGTFIRVPSSRVDLAKEFVGGRLDAAELKKKLEITPMPRMSSGEGRDGTLKSKLGIVSEAAKALLPFLASTPKPAAPVAAQVPEKTPETTLDAPSSPPTEAP